MDYSTPKFLKEAHLGKCHEFLLHSFLSLPSFLLLFLFLSLFIRFWHPMKELLFLGYQRMMYLKWKSAMEMEAIGFAPCPSIDLMWHTHLLFPDKYRRDMKALLGHVPAHKLLKEEERTLQFMDHRDCMEETMWRREFKQSLFSYCSEAVAKTSCEPNVNLVDDDDWDL
jgi:hypothetical protein